MFALYEVAEHLDINDKLWKDVNGFLAGVALDYGIDRARKSARKKMEVRECPGGGE